MQDRQRIERMESEFHEISNLLRWYPPRRYQDNPVWCAYYNRLQELKEELDSLKGKQW